MDFYLTARHIALTEGLRNHVERHLRQAGLGHTSLKATRMEVQLYKLSDRQVRFGCHVLVEFSHRHDVNLREESHDLYEAIDLAQKRLSRAVIEYRDKKLTDGRHTRKYSFERLARALGWGARRAER
jgi:ribosomal subunit interface protein